MIESIIVWIIIIGCIGIVGRRFYGNLTSTLEPNDKEICGSCKKCSSTTCEDNPPI